jgi:hypothetical protein
MAGETKSFSELLKEAPLAVDEKIITITGVLSRSNEPGKFVLRTGDNRILTLDVDAVKGHQVLSGMVGQTIVQVELDRNRVPDGIVEGPIAVTPGPGRITTNMFENTDPYEINPRNTSIEYPYAYIGYQNYGVVPGPVAVVAPFALATPHQVPVNSPDLIRTGITHPFMETQPLLDPGVQRP